MKKAFAPSTKSVSQAVSPPYPRSTMFTPTGASTVVVQRGGLPRLTARISDPHSVLMLTNRKAN